MNKIYKIRKEDIEKLPQLDRIEYKLERDRLKRYESISYWAGYSILIPSTIIFLLIYWFGNGIYYSIALNLFSQLVKVGIFAVGIGLLADILVWYLIYLEINKLNRKYFEKEVKWQKKNSKSKK